MRKASIAKRLSHDIVPTLGICHNPVAVDPVGKLPLKSVGAIRNFRISQKPLLLFQGFYLCGNILAILCGDTAFWRLKPKTTCQVVQ
jgi:hypothetical protein